MTLTLAANAVIAKLVTDDRAVRQLVNSTLSYQVDGAAYAAAYKAGRWDGKASFFRFSDNTFPRGFLPLVATTLQRAGYKVNVIKTPLPAPLGPEAPIVDDLPYDARYDYQSQVVDKLLRHGQIIAQVATGGGKSKCAALAVARIRRPTLFLTTRSLLMHQMAERFAPLDTVGILGDGQFKPRRWINVGMVQTLQARLKDEAAYAATKQLLSLFEFVILEEAHESSGDGYYDILQLCGNAHYRLALTATPFMKDSMEANLRLMASSGPVAIQVSEALLIDRGILATPYFKFVAMADKPEGLYKSTPWQKAVKVGIVENVARNRHCVAEAVRASRYGLSVMVLVQQQAHGKILKEMMGSAGLKAAYIFGEHEHVERTAALAALKAGRLDVLIGSTILDVGVDVPAVGMVILAGGGKAEVALRQRIGRGLREKKNGLPNVCFIVDFMDEFNLHLKSHAIQRQHIIQSTPGFGERIVADFPYREVGLIKRNCR